MVNLTDIRYLPRWIVLFMDVLILMLSMQITFLILHETINEDAYYFNFFESSILIATVNVGFMILFRTYAGIIRHSTFVDLFKLLLASFCSVVLLAMTNVWNSTYTGTKLLSFSLVSVYGAFSFILLFVFRLTIKQVYHHVQELGRSRYKKKVVILGMDSPTIALARAIMDNPNLPYEVVGFLTNKGESKRIKILGKAILSKQDFPRAEGLERIDSVLIDKDTLSRDELESWVNFALENNLTVLKVPTVQKLRKADLAYKIENLQIEDLLNRKVIEIENEEIKIIHQEKRILVTGGAGSIGSEIVRQLAVLNPELIVVLDQAETPLHEMELEMKKNHPLVNFKFVMIDVVNYHRLEQLFERYQFGIVYHAAAYKHVPLVEENPQEAIHTNILGSKNLAILSSIYKVRRFVMVSTDKAVNPTNVMGATKRTAELYVQSLQNLEGNTTKFITTRFGNVLGSNGSVIPLFRKQIAAGGPITITHPEIVRFFMTIREACELVLEAGSMGKGGEVYVFDMGEPVKILDLAKRMIKLSGLEPEKDIKIIYTGLRPGEKLFEELLTDTARTLPTYHQKIMISKDQSMPYEQIHAMVNKLIEALDSGEKVESVKVLKEIVPEFKSNNSIYQMLD